MEENQERIIKLNEKLINKVNQLEEALNKLRMDTIKELKPVKELKERRKEYNKEYYAKHKEELQKRARENAWKKKELEVKELEEEKKEKEKQQNSVNLLSS
jgi:hypothetical protein